MKTIGLDKAACLLLDALAVRYDDLYRGSWYTARPYPVRFDFYAGDVLHWAAAERMRFHRNGLATTLHDYLTYVMPLDLPHAAYSVPRERLLQLRGHVRWFHRPRAAKMTADSREWQLRCLTLYMIRRYWWDTIVVPQRGLS